MFFLSNYHSLLNFHKYSTAHIQRWMSSSPRLLASSPRLLDCIYPNFAFKSGSSQNIINNLYYFKSKMDEESHQPRQLQPQQPVLRNNSFIFDREGQRIRQERRNQQDQEHSNLPRMRAASSEAENVDWHQGQEGRIMRRRRPYLFQFLAFSFEREQLNASFEEQEKKKKVRVSLKKPESEACSICFEAFSTKKPIRKLECNHEFHRLCLEKWLLKKENCPSCRKPTPSRPIKGV